MDLGTLTLERAILHQIDKRATGQATAQVVLSQAEAILSIKDKTFIMDRLVKAIQNHAVPVVRSGEVDTGAAVVEALLAGTTSLVRASHALANRLASTQHAISPAGLLLVGELRDLKATRGVVVAKLEHEAGIQAVAQQTEAGLSTYSVSLIDDLVLSDAGKVFKVALFPEPQPPSALLGDVVDRQSSGRDVAHYFLGTFLGCQLVEKPDVQTQRFFEAAERYIGNIRDPERAARLQVALLAEMQSNSPRLNPSAFVVANLDPGERDGFTASLAQAGVPARPFAKDTERIRNKINLVRIQVDGQVTVLAPTSAIQSDGNPEGSVAITSGVTDVITIQGDVTSVSGASGRGLG